jgi:tRNA uridine 5-carboxymethylaminomethyl modification enzyme
MVEGDRVVGAVTQVGIQFRSRTVVLRPGLFWTARSMWG